METDRRSLISGEPHGLALLSFWTNLDKELPRLYRLYSGLSVYLSISIYKYMCIYIYVHTYEYVYISLYIYIHRRALLGSRDPPGVYNPVERPQHGFLGGACSNSSTEGKRRSSLGSRHQGASWCLEVLGTWNWLHN